MITQSELKTILKYDANTGIFTRIRNLEIAGRTDKKGYIVIKINYKQYFAHRLAFLYMIGRWPINQVDHADGIRDNNRWDNLRDADNTKNQYNRVIVNKTGYKGVSLMNNGWFVARIKVNRKTIYLGAFKTALEASLAYNKAADEHAGHFAFY